MTSASSPAPEHGAAPDTNADPRAARRRTTGNDERSPLGPDRVRPDPLTEDEVIDLRASRLAELVAGLTGCEPGGALHAVRASGDAPSGDALEVVARAMVDVDQPPPEGFRLAGFMRDDLPSSPHGSLRRWDRGEEDLHPPRDDE